MLHQKQGARVRISSREKVINMSEAYVPRDSICSCQRCDSMCCFSIRNRNSGIPCTCTDCDPNRCFTWEINRYESKPKKETRNINGSPEIAKDLLNVPETTIKFSTRNTKNLEHPINTTNETKKEKISDFVRCAESLTKPYLGNHQQINSSDDPELKEVFTNKEALIREGGTMKYFIENNKNKTNSKNKTIEIKNSRDHETPKYEIKNKHLSSNINMPLPQNDSFYSDAKGLSTRKIGITCKQKKSTDNTKSDLPEVYQIFTNEKRNIVKWRNISKDFENKHASASEQDNTKSNKRYCKESKVVMSKKKSSTESKLKINTKPKKTTKITCDHEHPKKDEISDTDFGNFTKYTDQNVTPNKKKLNKKNKSYEKYVPPLQNVGISYARPDHENFRAQLSAQIMNVPYVEFQDSLSRKPSPTGSNTCNNSINLEKKDIFTRLKEIYKACSCKVCECIAGKSLFNRSDICECEPCNCDECNEFMAKLQKGIIYLPEPGCPCLYCDRKDCKGVVKKTKCDDYQVCDCKASDNVRCAKSFTKPCSCIPCQCEKCQPSIFMPQMLTVANAAESLQQSNCDCEPCECTNCTSRYTAMSSNLMREISTGIIAYGNCNCEVCSNSTCQLGRSDCRCDSQHRLVRKPMAEKKADYGIHRVNIKENKYEKKIINNNNCNTITMLALSHYYPNQLFNYSNKKNSCECDVCECIMCKVKGKGGVTNKSPNIEKPNCRFNINPFNYYEYSSPRACQSCESLHVENVERKLYMETEFDACNSTNSEHVGYNLKLINNNENFNIKKAQPTIFTFKNKCSLECKKTVNVHALNSTDTYDGYICDNDQCHLLKRGILLTPSLCNNNGLTKKSSHIHIKPEKDSFQTENYLRNKIISNEQYTQLCRSKSRHNYFDNNYNEDIINETKVISTNGSILNMFSKEVGTKEIYKINSVDFKNGNVSKVFFERSKNNVQNDDSNTILLDACLTPITSKSSSHCNNNLEYNKPLNKYSKTSLLDRQEVEDFFIKPMCSSTDIHLSSAESMRLVKLLSEQKNLNIDKKNTRFFLQSLEKIPLKNLKMDVDDISLDSFAIDNYSYSSNNNLLNNMDQDKLDLETNLIDKKLDNKVIHAKNTTVTPELKTTKQIKPKENSNFQIVEKKPNNYYIRAKGGAAQPINNKPRSEAKIANNNLKSKTLDLSKDHVNKLNNKRYLEIPDVLNTAASCLHFTETDKRIDFEKSFKLLRKVNNSYDDIKKASPILRKNFFNPEVSKSKGMCCVPFLELDIKKAVKSTNTNCPYSPGAKPKTKVDELLYSPLLQSSQTNSQKEKSRSKSKCNSESNCPMSNATSQTNRKTIAVDKEIKCNMFESRENLRQIIQNFINMTLTNIVQSSDFETRKQNLIRDFTKLSSLNATKNSCGGLKASFVGLRKVSDHSVLLKWAMPRDVNNIQGYELQVDGHPVKKILNPSRCMAVLTCLPHCEKILLTIRTITDIETSHSPVTTIVYNPKKNKSGLY